MSGAGGRRDTPAARAALARRRQRAAQSLRPEPSVASGTGSAKTNTDVNANANANKNADEGDISGTKSTTSRGATIPRSRPTRSRSQARSISRPRPQPQIQPQPQSRPTTNTKPMLTVDTTPQKSITTTTAAAQAATTDGKSVAKRVAGVTSNSEHRRSVPSQPTSLTKRAHEKRIKSQSPNARQQQQQQQQDDQPSDILASSTSLSFMETATHSTAPSTLASYALTTATITTSSSFSPKEALHRSQHAADQANHILNAVQARNDYRAKSPTVAIGGNGTSMPTSTSSFSFLSSSSSPSHSHSPSSFSFATKNPPLNQRLSSPNSSRLEQQEELLEASNRRRQAMASRHRFTTTGVSETESDTSNTGNHKGGGNTRTSLSPLRPQQSLRGGHSQTSRQSSSLQNKSSLSSSSSSSLSKLPQRGLLGKGVSSPPRRHPVSSTNNTFSPKPPTSPRRPSSMQGEGPSTTDSKNMTSMITTSRDASPQRLQRPMRIQQQGTSTVNPPTTRMNTPPRVQRSSPSSQGPQHLRNSPTGNTYENNNNNNNNTTPIAQNLSAFIDDASLMDMTLLPMDTTTTMSTTTPPIQQEQQQQYQRTPYSEVPASTPPVEPSPGRPLFSDNDSADPSSIPLVIQEEDFTIDAAVLTSGCQVVIRSHLHPANIQVVTPEDNNSNDIKFASLSGVGLGRNEECFEIQKVLQSNTTTETRVIRPGDTILLVAPTADYSALGSRKFIHSSTGTSKIQLGFFGDSAKTELWTVLRALTSEEILVGRSVLTNEFSTTSLNDKKNAAATTAPIRSNDPILLRSLHNGGLLSVDESGQLCVLTDSYRHTQRKQNSSLLGGLQQHDRLFPTQGDMFQLILSAVPPCPSWISSHNSEERMYLTGSYLFQTHRNDASSNRNNQIEAYLFDNTAHGHSNAILEATQRYKALDENLSPETKERILMDEVIGSFLGLEGRYIQIAQQTDSGGICFQLCEEGSDDVSFDVGLRQLVDQILSLSTSFIRVRSFVASHYPGYEYGRVMQAFCEALDALIQDYVHFVSQLEWELRRANKGEALTMKNIYFQITSSLHSMSVLEHATETVSESKGGELINTLWALDKRNYMGDTVAKRVLGILLDKASVPYMEMMSDWLQTGKLNDPHKEFMIEKGSNKPNLSNVRDGDSWQTLFQINDDHVVQGLAPNTWTKDKILTTGKYWNALQECHTDLKTVARPMRQSKIPRLPFNSDSSVVASYIDGKYQSASKVLVQVLMENFKLMDSLQIMKRYFLIDQGGFLMHFLDAAEQELLKPREDVSMGRLQHWLNTSVQLTEAHKEELDPISGARIACSSCPLLPVSLRCRLSDETLVGHLDSLHGGGIAEPGPVTPSRRVYGTSHHITGIEVFTIDFPRVPFPISLLMSKKTMDDYKLLFRHLFFTKHVERRLIGVWRDNQLLKKLDELRGLLGPTFLLRQRMLHFIQNLIYYMVFEVVESHWMDMINLLDGNSNGRTEKPQTVDDILKIHSNFLARTIEACLLNKSELIRSLTKVMNTCLLFTDQMKRFMDTTKIYDDSLTRAAEKRGVVQRNLNERGLTQGQQNKREVRKALSTANEERQSIQNRQVRRVGREVSSKSYQRMVRRFDEVFNQDLSTFMRQLNAHTSTGIVASLGIRLDYNGFVTGMMANER